MHLGILHHGTIACTGDLQCHHETPNAIRLGNHDEVLDAELDVAGLFEFHWAKNKGKKIEWVGSGPSSSREVKGYPQPSLCRSGPVALSSVVCFPKWSYNQ